MLPNIKYFRIKKFHFHPINFDMHISFKRDHEHFCFVPIRTSITVNLKKDESKI